MSFIDGIKDLAKSNIKTIVLPEALDIRTIEATHEIIKEGFAKVVLVGNEDEIKSKAGAIDISGAEIINPVNSEKYNLYCESLYELRKSKGITLEDAQKLIKDPVYYGMMMVKLGDADGLVSGACHSTADTLRPALQILKTAPNTKLVSSFFIMDVPNCEYGEDGLFVFSDCGLVENPDSESLSEIAISSAKSFEQLVKKQAKVAMLSYSTMGSGKSDMVQKVIDATVLVKEKVSDILVDGELQLDAAIVPEIGKMKAPNSKVAGNANVLIFPDLEAGNIGYKLVERLAKAKAYGPLTQGIAKPINDLSRGCCSADIVGVVAFTCVQAQN